MSVLTSAGHVFPAPLSTPWRAAFPPARLTSAQPDLTRLHLGHCSSHVAGPPQGLPSGPRPRDPFPALHRAPPLFSHLLPLPSLLRSHRRECLHVVPLGDTLIPSWTCPLILSSGSESIPFPACFQEVGSNEKPFPSFSASLPLSSHFDETWPSVTVPGPLGC